MKPETVEQSRGNRDRRAETGRALDERAERERDQQRLDAAIGGEPRDRRLDDLELTRRDGQVVQEDRVDDDPADREEPVGGAVDRRAERGRDAASRRRRSIRAAPRSGP